jgi:nuclear receptor interaction protein
MTGRDKLKEMGKSVSPIHNLSDREQELLSQATLCVKKFAPRGQRDMKRGNHGHITALKISDARPSEMIVSWSGEHIYAFDLVGESQDNERNLSTSHKRAKESHDRKRKRRPEGSDASLAQVSSRQRTDSPSISGQDTALRITYQNGQSEEISLPHPAPLTETQRAARQMAKSTVKLCNSLFQPSREDCESNAAFTKTLGHAALVLDEIEHVVWGYPMDPDAEQVQTEQTFRRTRESTRQFVQASGTLSRALGGTLDSEMTAQFLAIETRRSHLAVTLREQFCYDFLKSILLWLESGVGQLIEAFTRPADMSPSSKAASRLPIPANEATSEALDDILIPYLLQLASDRPIVNLEANRFETAENRMLFATEKAAVLAFAAAVRIPFEDLSAAIVLSEDSERVHAQDRQTAHRYWARKVGRGILFNVAEGLSFAAVDRAFGGVGKTPRHVAELETELRELAINRHDGQDGPMAGVSNSMITAGDHDDLGEREHTGDSEAIETDDDVLISSEDDAGDDGGDDDETHPDSSSEDDRDEFLPYPGGQQFLFCSALDRRQVRPTVEPHVDCARPIRPPYRGHLNARTVKDVNYIGGDDEYVVSGSDDGNVFIWDSKTSKLINILEGDCEVVNVVQGHPYEPMLAVSGIDSTIKIFSPDGRARANARRGDNINVDVPTDIKQVPTEYARQHSPGSEPATPASYDGSDDDDRVELNGLASRKRMWELASIMEMNEEQRQGHNQDDPLVSVNAHLVQFLMRNGLIQ